MGYTHYWRVQRNTPSDLLIEAGRRMALIVEAESELLAGWDGTGKPTLDPTTGAVRFNGIGPDDDHETFYWPPDLAEEKSAWEKEGEPVFTFCKTAQKPYDTAVVACLLVAQDVLGDYIEINSDASDLDEFLGRSQRDRKSVV